MLRATILGGREGIMGLGDDMKIALVQYHFDLNSIVSTKQVGYQLSMHPSRSYLWHFSPAACSDYHVSIHENTLSSHYIMNFLPTRRLIET